MLVPSKNEEGLIPFVLSIIWEGMTKSPGRISSRKDPTAENATIALTPSDLRAAIFARVGTEDGLMLWAVPCRAMKATRTPDGRAEMVMGELGNPHGWTHARQHHLFSFIRYAYGLGVDLLTVELGD